MSREILITGQQIIVGADIGGSKAAITLVDGGDARHELVVPSADWHRQGAGGVARNLAALILSECGDTADGTSATDRVPRYIVAVGAHGTDTLSQCERLQRELEAEMPARVLALNDAELLLPAVGRSAGVGLVSGTGSIAIGYGAGDELISVGGWGGYLGDEGSATGLFIDAARALVRARDRGEPADPMEGVLLDLCGLTELRDLPAALGDRGSPTAWAHLLPELYDRSLALGSPTARTVLAQSADVLAGLVQTLARRGCETSTVVAGGGLVANASWLQDALRDALTRRQPSSELVTLTSPPVDGAVWLATQLATLLLSSPESSKELHPALRRRLTALRTTIPATGVLKS